MAALGPVRRMLLLCGIIGGALTVAAGLSGAAAIAVPDPAITVVAARNGDERGGFKAAVQQARWGHFCRWYSHHRLCFKLIKAHRFCDRRPHNRLCEDDDDDRFCRKRPDHPLCDDDRFCRKRPDHPLCDDEQPPSPS